MAYRIIKCRWESGEHYRMLVDRNTGIPAFWPTLYITTQVRNKGQSVAAMEKSDCQGLFSSIDLGKFQLTAPGLVMLTTAIDVAQPGASTWSA